MPLLPTAEPIPLTRDGDGVVRVGAGRAALDTVLAAFREGMTPEGLVEQCPSPRLAEVDSVIGDVLRHPEQARLEMGKLALENTRESRKAFPPTITPTRALQRRPVLHLQAVHPQQFGSIVGH